MEPYSTKKRSVAIHATTWQDIVLVTKLYDKKYLWDLHIPYSKITSYCDEHGAMKRRVSVKYYALDSWTILTPILDPMMKPNFSRTANKSNDSPGKSTRKESI